MSPPQIICNPLLFGFRADCPGAEMATCLATAKPQCTQRVKNATAICEEVSRDGKYAARAVELIKNNKSAYDQFAKDLNGLCDEKSIHESNNLKKTADNKPRKNYDLLVKDVLWTCELAKTRFKVVTEAYARVAKASSSAPASGGRK